MVATAAAWADPSDPPRSTVRASPPSTQPATQPVDEAATPLPTTPGDHKLRFRTHVNGQTVDMAYLLHLPPRYDIDGPGGKHPLLVFLHGSGENGSDLAGIYMHGPMSLLKKDGGNPDFAASAPFVVLAPQCPPRGQRWDMEAMTAGLKVLIDSVADRGRIDADRVYLTGLSMGALGTWCLAQHDPDRFAAIAPMNGLGWHPERAGQRLRTVPVWSAVGLNDESKFIDAAKTMDAALAGAPVDRRFSYLIGNGHDAFWPTYQDPDFFEWLLAHRRPSPAARARLAAPSPTDTPTPTTPGHHFCTWATKVGDQPCQMDFVVYLPKGYDATKRYPTLLFLREGDTVGPDFHDICVHGPDLAVERSSTLADGYPFIIVSPHWPAKCDWQSPGMTPALLGLLDHLSGGGVAIDRDRITATGVNAGANGVWKLAFEAPDRFAAVVPVETNVPPPETVPAEQLSGVVRMLPVRAFAAAADVSGIDRLTRVAAGSSRDLKVTALPAVATPLGALPPYTDPAVMAWIARQSRPTPAASANAK